jgi:hypothetical protein
MKKTGNSRQLNKCMIKMSVKMNIEGLGHEVLSKLCRDNPSEMADIILLMQSDITEMKLERMVNRYLVLFHDAKKILRTNFFNYTYTLYQLCVLLDQTQYLPYILLMKDLDKQREQDQIWKKVCDSLNWAYIPSI